MIETLFLALCFFAFQLLGIEWLLKAIFWDSLIQPYLLGNRIMVCFSCRGRNSRKISELHTSLRQGSSAGEDMEWTCSFCKAPNTYNKKEWVSYPTIHSCERSDYCNVCTSNRASLQNFVSSRRDGKGSNARIKETDQDFCYSCLHNQQIVITLLATDPPKGTSFAQYKKRIFKRHPISCQSCNLRSISKIEMINSKFKKDILLSRLEASRLESRSIKRRSFFGFIHKVQAFSKLFGILHYLQFPLFLFIRLLLITPRVISLYNIFINFNFSTPPTTAYDHCIFGDLSVDCLAGITLLPSSISLWDLRYILFCIPSLYLFIAVVFNNLLPSVTSRKYLFSVERLFKWEQPLNLCFLILCCLWLKSPSDLDSFIFFNAILIIWAFLGCFDTLDWDFAFDNGRIGGYFTDGGKTSKDQYQTPLELAQQDDPFRLFDDLSLN